MRVKDKLIKEKQSITERQNLKHTDSTPLLMRLQKQYLFAQNNQQQNQQNLQNNGIKQLKTSRDSKHYKNKASDENYYHLRQNKQNKQIMINSVPASAYNNYLGQSNVEHVRSSKNIIKIDNYENKKFKTQNGYIPEMTKSRYEAPSDNSSIEDNVYTSQQKIVMRNIAKSHRYNENTENMTNRSKQYERPLTFGLINKQQYDNNIKASMEYQEDVKLQNSILDEINSLNLRKSQETLYNSKDYSQEDGFSQIPRCANHNNKKAKYRLVTDYEQRDQQMIYCSKCAINLLQQGFKVEELGKKNDQMFNKQSKKLLISSKNQNNMIKSMSGNGSRLQEMRSFQQKLGAVEDKLHRSIQEAEDTHNSKQNQIDNDIQQTQKVYCYLLDTLQQMKNLDLNLLNQIRKQKLDSHSQNVKGLEVELANICEMKKQIKEYRNKFIIMKESEFQFLLSSFLNKINSYAEPHTVNLEHEQMLDYRKCEISEKVDRIVQSLWDYGREIETEQQSVIQSSIKKNKYQIEPKNLKTHLNTENAENQDSYSINNRSDQFLCEQIKRPFRTLFEDDDQIRAKEQNNKTHDMKKSIKGKEKNNRQKNTYPYSHNQYYPNNNQPINEGYYTNTNYIHLQDDNGSPSFKK